MSVREAENPQLFARVQEQNLLRQYDLLTNCIEIGLSKGIEAFDKYTLWSLNGVAVSNIAQFGGRFREQPIYVGNHIPPHFVNVPELVDQFRDIHKVRRYVIADVYWLFAKASPKLGNIGHRHAIQRPQCILVECLNALTKAYFDAIRKQVILPKQILLLHTSEQLRVFGLSDGHRNATPTFDRKLRL